MNTNPWPKDISQARRIQDALKKLVRITPKRLTSGYIAAVDASFVENKIIAVATLYKYPELCLLRDAFSVEKVRFPYIPGFLSFREGPAIINALRKLRAKPDIILFDGQGIAHPKGIGLASHIGVILDIPAIGCAKSRLIGDFEEPDSMKGSWTFLYYKGKKVGVVLRTRSSVRPVFVSPGHLVDMRSSVEIVMRCVSAYRIPDPLRRADSISKRLRRL
ncbi:MAG: deoxyribonuclease V [Nitrospirota bacterium]